MEQRTILTANVIRALKAYWIASPSHVTEEMAFYELTKTLDLYFGGENEPNNAKEASEEH